MTENTFDACAWLIAPAIADAKITAYLLNVDHPQGGPKARYFLERGFERGFSLETPGPFIEAMLRHCVASSLVQTVRTEFSVKHVYEAPMPTPDGQCPRIRSVWSVADGDLWQRLVTAYRI